MAVTDEELTDFELDVLPEFRAGSTRGRAGRRTIRSDTTHLEQVREWFGGRWAMEPRDGDRYFGAVLRDAKPSTRAGRAQALVT